MSDQIKVGDLVMVIKPQPCGCALHVGKTFIVPETDHGNLHCGICSAPRVEGLDLAIVPAVLAVPFRCLKKIDPPAQPETVKTHDEVPA